MTGSESRMNHAYLDVILLIERLHRQFLDVLKLELDGMGIGDAAPRAMAHAADKALRAAEIDPKDVKFIVPHQAGSGIVRLAAMQLEQIGVAGEVINGLTREVAVGPELVDQLASPGPEQL